MSLYSVNSITLVGNISLPPALNETASGHRVCVLNIATSESIKKPDGTYDQIPSYHRVTLWDKTADRAAKSVVGESVYVEGRLTYGKYEKDGRTTYTHTITANKFISFSKKPNTASQDKPDPLADFPDKQKVSKLEDDEFEF